MINKKVGKFYNRKSRIFFLYKIYLLKIDFNNKDEFNLSLDLTYNFFSDEQREFIFQIITNFSDLEEKIKEKITNNWNWNRYNLVEKSIILNGVAEMILSNNKKSIVLNESIEFAKKYCGIKAPSLINGILEQF